MNTLGDVLEHVVRDTPGAVGAILMGFDGIAVVQHVAPGREDFDLETLAMEFSYRFAEMRKAATSLDLGEVADLSVRTDRGAVVCRALSADYFVAIVMDDARHLGKGRYLLRSAASSLQTELA